MKVILLKDTAKLGKRGEVRDVAEGYAINVLIKKGDAVQATPSELAKWKAKEDSKNHKKEVETSTFAKLVHDIHQSAIIIRGKKSDAKGQLFAQIKEVDIVDAIFEALKLSVDPKQIIITVPIKSVGKHTVTLKQGDKKEQVSVVVE